VVLRVSWQEFASYAFIGQAATTIEKRTFSAVIWEDMSMKPPHTLAAAFVLTIITAMVALAAPAQAQAYDPRHPVCLQVYDDIAHTTIDCSFTSMGQCAATASGRFAQCVFNPYFAAPKAKPGPRKKRAT
jgi:hypothetical protein